MGDVLGKFLEPLQRQYPLPKHAEGHETEFWTDYIRVLKNFDDKTLEKAADNIIGTRAGRTFPNPAECNRSCKEVIEANAIERIKPEQKFAQHGYQAVESKYPEFSQYRIQSAYNMMKGSDLGRQAAEEYWIWGLHDFCREEQRLPDRHEIERIKSKSRMVLKDLNDCLNAPVTNPDFLPMRGALLNNWVASYAAKCRMIDFVPDQDDLQKLFVHEDNENA